ncbi:hypothetical protein F0562_003521 [Nyssa sinensis]|uniref:Uncharacterized protein n=1 Tax=Nyssa sinensis TaxID=561372 RepID=A0A5J5BZL6_9ASTE|nr:hypothetical protein F0562_003521 [Nyssa sinensis]
MDRPKPQIKIRILNKTVHDHRRNWALHLSEALWAYKITKSELMGESPFTLVYGSKTLMLMELTIPSMIVALTCGLHPKSCLEKTDVDEVFSAESLLKSPALFVGFRIIEWYSESNNEDAKLDQADLLEYLKLYEKFLVP